MIAIPLLSDLTLPEILKVFLYPHVLGIIDTRLSRVISVALKSYWTDPDQKFSLMNAITCEALAWLLMDIIFVHHMNKHSTHRNCL